MPLQTFMNLPEERQQEIREAAIAEFALHDYANASVSNIVKALGVAKGSFYRYFESKEDLYQYLLDHTTGMRITNIDALISNPPEDFFDMLAENFSQKIKFDMQYPVLSGFLYNVMNERQSGEAAAVLMQTRLQLQSLIRRILLLYIGKGQLRSDMDIDLMAHYVMTVQSSIIDYMALRYKVDLRENIKRGKPVFSLPEAEILEIARGMAELMRQGMQQHTFKKKI